MGVSDPALNDSVREIGQGGSPMRTQTGWGRATAMITPVALFSLFTLMFAATGSQAADPQLLGRVIDTEGAVVADAMVLLTPVNRTNGRPPIASRTLKSDQEGAFYAALPAGRYPRKPSSCACRRSAASSCAPWIWTAVRSRLQCKRC